MANVYAVKTGNWSDTTVWNTSALPTSADDVYANTYTVTIDQDVTVLSIRTTSATGITAGGGFACSTARTITASGTGIAAGSTNCLTCSNSSGTTITINAAITASVSSSGIGLVISSNGTVNITGAITASINSSNIYGVSITGAATVNIVGSIVGGFGGAGSATTHGIYVTAAASITITGNCTAGANYSNNDGIRSIAASSIQVTGTVSGSSSGTGNGINSTNASGTVSIIGQVVASSAPAIAGSSTFTVTGPFISGSTGVLFSIVTGPVKLSAITANEFRFKSSGAGTASLWSSDVNSGAPSAANVRSGTKFGVSNEFTGTLAVPAAGSVALGVPVDNTTGTAVLRTSDVANIVSAITTAALDSVE